MVKERRKFVLYQVRVITQFSEWSVSKRYSDFSKLAERLARIAEMEQADFPRFPFSSLRLSSDPDTIEMRMRDLRKWSERLLKFYQKMALMEIDRPRRPDLLERIVESFFRLHKGLRKEMEAANLIQQEWRRRRSDLKVQRLRSTVFKAMGMNTTLLTIPEELLAMVLQFLSQ